MSVGAYIYSNGIFILVESQDEFHGTFTSITGTHSFAAEPATDDWLGSKTRLALQTASLTDVSRSEWDPQRYEENARFAEEVHQRLIVQISHQFNYKKGERIMSKCIAVFAQLSSRVPDQLSIYATNHKRGGFAALANKKREGNVLVASLTDSDVMLGRSIRAMLQVSTLMKKRVNHAGAADRVSPD